MSFTHDDIVRWMDEAACKGFLNLDKMSITNMYRSMGWGGALRSEPRQLMSNVEPGAVHPYAAFYAEGWDDFQKFYRGELTLVPDYVMPSNAMG